MERQQRLDSPEAAARPLVPRHPEEMNAQLALGFGQGRSFLATARATPAGLVSVGVLVSTILLSVAVLVRVAKPRR